MPIFIWYTASNSPMTTSMSLSRTIISTSRRTRRLRLSNWIPSRWNHSFWYHDYNHSPLPVHSILGRAEDVNDYDTRYAWFLFLQIFFERRWYLCGIRSHMCLFSYFHFFFLIWTIISLTLYEAIAFATFVGLNFCFDTPSILTSSIFFETSTGTAIKKHQLYLPMQSNESRRSNITS